MFGAALTTPLLTAIGVFAVSGSVAAAEHSINANCPEAD
jgi:hypothetical protein